MRGPFLGVERTTGRLVLSSVGTEHFADHRTVPPRAGVHPSAVAACVGTSLLLPFLSGETSSEICNPGCVLPAPAAFTPFWRQVGVRRRVLMASPAMRLTRIDRGGCRSPKRVLPTRDEFQVGRVAAATDSAQMVELAILRDRADEVFVDDAVGLLGASGFSRSVTDAAVAVARGSRPQPAAGRVHNHPSHQSLHHGSCRHYSLTLTNTGEIGP